MVREWNLEVPQRQQRDILSIKAKNNTATAELCLQVNSCRCSFHSLKFNFQQFVALKVCASVCPDGLVTLQKWHQMMLIKMFCRGKPETCQIHHKYCGLFKFLLGLISWYKHYQAHKVEATRWDTPMCISPTHLLLQAVCTTLASTSASEHNSWHSH